MDLKIVSIGVGILAGTAGIAIYPTAGSARVEMGDHYE